MTKKMTIQTVALCALFAALTTILSQLAIPIGLVPINLAALSVFLAGGILGAKYGALSQLCYVLLGAVGIPVFASFRGGIGILTGPTGGYIIGYIAAAWLIGFLIEKMGMKIWVLIISLTSGLILCYLLGTIWFIIVTENSIAASLISCVIPFLPGDALKIFLACILIPKLKKLMIKTA